MSEVLFVACAALPEGDGDEAAVLPALAAAGIDTRWVSWDDPSVDFDAADLVILRATWDYPERRDEFLAWCAARPNLRNPLAAVRWNTDKRYLIDLADRDVATVPTELLPVGTRATWPSGDFVVKPSVGAGSRGAARFGHGDHDLATKHLKSLHEQGFDALLQPYQSQVDTEGETALVFFAGEYSHAFTKGAMLTGSALDKSGLYVAEKLGGAQPDDAQLVLAGRAMDSAAGLLGLRRSELLYARVDLVRADDGTPSVLELELTEPSLGFRQSDAAAVARFVSAVSAALG